MAGSSGAGELLLSDPYAAPKRLINHVFKKSVLPAGDLSVINALSYDKMRFLGIYNRPIGKLGNGKSPMAYDLLPARRKIGKAANCKTTEKAISPGSEIP